MDQGHEEELGAWEVRACSAGGTASLADRWAAIPRPGGQSRAPPLQGFGGIPSGPGDNLAPCPALPWSKGRKQESQGGEVVGNGDGGPTPLAQTVNGTPTGLGTPSLAPSPLHILSPDATTEIQSMWGRRAGDPVKVTSWK